eukprot:4677800-Amphidinium_carterae.1
MESEFETPQPSQLANDCASMPVVLPLGPGALELFAGDAKLTASLKQHGFQAMGLDGRKLKQRFGPCTV